MMRIRFRRKKKMQRYNNETLKLLFFEKGLDVIEDLQQLSQITRLYPEGFITEKEAVFAISMKACELTARLSGNAIYFNTGIATLKKLQEVSGNSSQD